MPLPEGLDKVTLPPFVTTEDGFFHVMTRTRAGFDNAVEFGRANGSRFRLDEAGVQATWHDDEQKCIWFVQKPTLEQEEKLNEAALAASYRGEDKPWSRRRR